MRTTLALTAPALLAALGVALADDDERDWTPEEAGKSFRQACLACHQPPDPAFFTDRAWMGQVPDTA